MLGEGFFVFLCGISMEGLVVLICKDSDSYILI